MGATSRHIRREPRRRDRDSGRLLGVVSQPDRVTYDDDPAGGADPAAFEQTVLVPLQAIRRRDRRRLRRRAADDRWIAEIADGLAIDQLRPKFMLATYRATGGSLAPAQR